MTTENNIALCLMNGGRDRMERGEIRRCAEVIGVSERQIYRYLKHIFWAKKLLRDANISTMAD